MLSVYHICNTKWKAASFKWQHFYNTAEVEGNCHYIQKFTQMYVK